MSLWVSRNYRWWLRVQLLLVSGDEVVVGSEVTGSITSEVVTVVYAGCAVYAERWLGGEAIMCQVGELSTQHCR